MKETFLVSARKYRPTTFKDVVGQEVIVQTLKNAILQNKVAQSFLFTGPRGVGKTTCARIFAKTINCENITPDGEACNQCKSCQSFNNNASFNIYELDAASNNSVEDIRQLIEQVRIPPQDGKYKIYIIDEVHMLSAHAFNSFLKTLEEPPAYAKFILATTERHKILPTILSRCQVYHFKRISIQDMVNHLQYVASQEGIFAEEEALRIIATRADGAMRDALSIFDQMVALTGGKITHKSVLEALFVLDYDVYFQFSEAFLDHNYVQTLTLLNDILSKGFDGSHLLNGLTSHFRQLILAKTPKTIELLELGSTLQQRYEDHSKRFPLPWLIDALNILVKAEFDYRQSNIKTIFLENLFLQLCFLGDQQQKPLPTSLVSPSNTTQQQPPKTTSPTSPNFVQNNPTPTTVDTVRRPSSIKISQVSHDTDSNNLNASLPKPIDEEALQQLMIYLSSTFQQHKDAKNYFDIFQGCTPIKNNDHSISLMFQHAVKMAEAEKHRVKIADLIRRFFNNNNLSVQFLLSDQTSSSSKEKILQKFPEFQKFVEILSLKQEN